MKTVLLFSLMIFMSTFAFSQANFGFGEGKIILKTGDTISCLVERALNYGFKVGYKKTEGGAVSYIPSKDIKALITPHKYFQNIQTGKQERLMGLAVDGKSRLFNYVILDEGNGSTQVFGPPTIIYTVNKNDSYTEVKKKTLKNVSSQLFADCPSVIQKINDKTYSFDDMEKIVMEYNACQ